MQMKNHTSEGHERLVREFDAAMEWRKNRALKVERGHLDVVYVAFVVVEDAGVLEREAVHVRAA
jgi:hypothetical protein